jgi:hypothetical protein
MTVNALCQQLVAVFKFESEFLNELFQVRTLLLGVSLLPRELMEMLSSRYT